MKAADEEVEGQAEDATGAGSVLLHWIGHRIGHDKSLLTIMRGLLHFPVERNSGHSESSALI